MSTASIKVPLVFQTLPDAVVLFDFELMLNSLVSSYCHIETLTPFYGTLARKSDVMTSKKKIFFSVCLLHTPFCTRLLRKGFQLFHSPFSLHSDMCTYFHSDSLEAVIIQHVNIYTYIYINGCIKVHLLYSLSYFCSKIY